MEVGARLMLARPPAPVPRNVTVKDWSEIGAAVDVDVDVDGNWQSPRLLFELFEYLFSGFCRLW